MKKDSMTLGVTVNTEPVLSCIKAIKSTLDSLPRSVHVPEPPPDLFRVESHDGAAGTGELTLTLHPSDALLGFLAAVRALQADLERDAQFLEHFRTGEVPTDMLKKLQESFIQEDIDLLTAQCPSGGVEAQS